MTRAGFDSLDDALSAAAIDVDGLRRRVRAAEDAQAAVEAQLQDPQLAGLTADEHIDVARPRPDRPGRRRRRGAGDQPRAQR